MHVSLAILSSSFYEPYLFSGQKENVILLPACPGVTSESDITPKKSEAHRRRSNQMTEPPQISSFITVEHHSELFPVDGSPFSFSKAIACIKYLIILVIV